MKKRPLLARALCSLSLMLSLLAGPAFAAEPFPYAVQEDDLDYASCRIVTDGKSEPLEEADVRVILGLEPPAPGTKLDNRRPWPAPPAPQILLAFKKPVAIGTILGGEGELKILKPGGKVDAALLANPDLGPDWLTVADIPPQNAPRLAPLPPGTSTQAVLFSAWKTRTTLADLRLFSDRILNLTPYALANAQAEWTTDPYLSAPMTYAAARITDGKGDWINSGKNGQGINARAPITDLAPTWFVLSWPEARSIDGLVMEDNFAQFTVQIYTGPAGVNPAVATDDEWKTLTKTEEVKVRASSGGQQRWITFPPEQTRALRLHITKSTYDKEPAVARLYALQTFSLIGQQPVPKLMAEAPSAPPFAVPYELAAPGEVTLVINNADGSRLKNLIANIPQAAGKNGAKWDLKDENGLYVQPGKYTWKAITHPPLEFRYEMSVYPNMNQWFPDRTAWLNGPDGAGGWLADHSSPGAVCAAGDRVFAGAHCAESGVALAECDLEGKKLWGHASFEAWTGVGMLAANETELFNTMPATVFAKVGLDKKSDVIWAVDLKTHEVRTVGTLQPSASRKRGIQGFAAHGEKIYMAVHAPDDWLNNAASAADVDVAACLPSYAATVRKERKPHEVVFDPLSDFLRLFRLRDTPPGQGSSSIGLNMLESTKTGDKRQHIVLAFSKPVAVGSLVFPPPAKEEKVQFQISVLKPGSAWPPRAHAKDDWEVVPLTDTSAWAVQALPPGTTTRALKLTFIRASAGAADDLLSDVEDTAGGPSLDGPEMGVDNKTIGSGKKSGFESADDGLWQRKIEGMKLLSRRFENLFSTAKVSVNSGTVAADGTWDAERTEPLSVANPGIYAMEWAQAQSLRGLAVKEIEAARTEIDIFTGKGPIDINATEGWENVGTYEQAQREYYQPDPFHNSTARYLDGYVDFGRSVETRAVRLRVVRQWESHKPVGVRAAGVRNDCGGTTLDLTRCRVYGVAPLKYLGGEKAVDEMATQRVEEIDAASGKVVREVKLEGVGTPGGKPWRGNALAVNKTGEVFALANNQIVRVDFENEEHKPLTSDLKEPTALACDAAGNLYVFDAAKERKTIRVYSPDGKLLREIGEPGGYRRGPWNPNRMEQASALTVDAQGKVWAANNLYWPKRVTIWNADGTFNKELLGPTQYGGGGAIDPADKRRVIYGPLEFEVDWATGKSRLKNFLYDAAYGGYTSDIADTPRRVETPGGNRLYLVNTTPTNVHMECAIAYLHEGDHARLVAAAGVASEFKPMLDALGDPALVKMTDGKPLTEFLFAWSDLNGDEKVQSNEVQLWPKPEGRPIATFDHQLGVQIGPIGFRVKEWRPDGVPVYERVDTPAVWPGRTLRLDSGNYYHFENASGNQQTGVQTADGKWLWTYQTEGSGVHALVRSKPMHDGQLMSELGIAGHLTAHAGDLGEFVVLNVNVGVWNVMSADGLFAGTIFTDQRRPGARPWSFTEAKRGMSLENVTVGQEHFNGYVTRTEDNKYYAVAGHNHVSIVEILGLDQYKRFGGEITVTAEDINAARAWEKAAAMRQVFKRAPVIDCYRTNTPVKLDGNLNDWGSPSAEIDGNTTLRMAYDNEFLYLAYEVDRQGPFINKGSQWDRLFKTGASVDLQIAADPAAAGDRKGALPGDQRLLMTFMGDEPTAVLYESVVPGTPQTAVWQAVSPIGSVSFDRVSRLENPRLFASGTRRDDNRFVVEAAIPLKALGLKITPGMRLRMDWGVLTTGPEGTEVTKREYWANKTTQILADVPSEAAIHPDLWGHVRFHDGAANAKLDPTLEKSDKGLDDLLNDLK